MKTETTKISINISSDLLYLIDNHTENKIRLTRTQTIEHILNEYFNNKTK